MTSRQNFEALKEWIQKDDIDVEVDVTYYDSIATPEKDRIINGCAGQDGYIILYKDAKDENYDTLTSLLIHEYGHVVEWRDKGRDRHSEKQAWETGISAVPKEFWPPTLKVECSLCPINQQISDPGSSIPWSALGRIRNLGQPVTNLTQSCLKPAIGVMCWISIATGKSPQSSPT